MPREEERLRRIVQDAVRPLARQLEILRQDMHRWLGELAERLRQTELRAARIEERLRVQERYRMPWYRAFAGAFLSAVAGALAALFALFLGGRRP